jgi:hypothetical protein
MRHTGVIVLIALLLSGCGPLPPPAARPPQLVVGMFHATRATTARVDLERTALGSDDSAQNAELDLLRAASLN